MAIDLVAVYSRRLLVVDVSAVLHTYTSYSISRKDTSAVTVKGVNIAGVKAIAEICAINYRDRRRVVLCLDNYDKKRGENDDGYKANRKFPPDIAAQTKIIQTYFDKFGVTVLSPTGTREADDLLYSAVISNLDRFHDIEVITGDADNYGCIEAPHVHITGVNSLSPSISVSNYSDCVSSHANVPYNCILPYLVFTSKRSNNLNVLPLDGKNSYYFDEFVKMLQKDEDMEHGSRVEKMIAFLESGIVAPEHVDAIVQRCMRTYPQMQNIELDCRGPALDTEVMATVLNFLRLNTAAKCYGMSGALSSAKDDPALRTLMKQLFKMVKTGVAYADAGIRYDLNRADLQISSNEFREVGDW